MIERKDGKLKKLKSQSIIQRLLFFDTETYINETKPKYFEFPLRLGVAIYVELGTEANIIRREETIFYSTDEFLDLLRRYTHKGKLLNVFAHNIGFDIRVLHLVHRFIELGWTSKPPIINAKTFIWKVHTDRGNISFLDTANYGVISVEKLGEDLGLPKLDIDFNTSSDIDLITYCRRDVELLEQFILGFITLLHTHQLGAFKYTIASQSYTTYRTVFMDKQPSIHNNQEALDLERKAYHGGRTEAFFIGKLKGDTFYDMDVNSMYPYVMQKYSMPTKLLSIAHNTSPKLILSQMEHYYFIADVTLNTDTNLYPVYDGKKLIFPTGEFRAYLHHIELKYAIEHNHVVKVHTSIKYSMDTIFKEFIDFFYPLRQEHKKQGNASWSLVIKLLMNSLYGKTGELQSHREVIGFCDDNDIFIEPLSYIASQKRGHQIGWFGTVYFDYKQGETLNSIPAIAGAITAYARYTLFQYIQEARPENVFYCDTDSLFINSIGYRNIKHLIDNTKLGSLKQEAKSKNVTIYGAKDYIFGKVHKTKGVNAKAEQTSANSWEMLQFQSFNEWMKNGQDSPPNARKITKQRRSPYNKGLVTEDGPVIPFHLHLQIDGD